MSTKNLQKKFGFINLSEWLIVLSQDQYEELHDFKDGSLMFLWHKRGNRQEKEKAIKFLC